MERRRKKWILQRIAIPLVTLLIVCIFTAVDVVHTQWLSDFLRAKIIATIEGATGGRAEVQSFTFELSHLNVRLRGLVLHGKEPSNERPLAAADLIELHLKLFSSFGKAIDLAFLGIQRPRINLLVYPDGSTNIPTPRVKSKPSGKSSLATVVDLAIGQFRIDSGSISYAKRVSSFALEGNDLRVLLDYNTQRDNYTGRVHMAPLNVLSAQNHPVGLTVDLPVAFDRDAISINNGRITSDGSEVGLDASLKNLNAPKIGAKLEAKLSLDELRRGLNLPIESGAKNAPAFITTHLEGTYEGESATVALHTLDVRLGRSSIEAEGTANPSSGETVGFHGDLSLGELSALLNMTTAKVDGELSLHGRAGIDRRNNYFVSGDLSSRALNVTAGKTTLSNVSLSAPFRIGAGDIGLAPLRLGALGGTISARVTLAQMRNLSATADLRDFSVNSLAAMFTGKPLDYAGAIGGNVQATGDLKAASGVDLAAHARLAIAARGKGVPLTGLIEAHYDEKHGTLELGNSRIDWPRSHATFVGPLNHSLAVHLTSTNLNDFLPVARWTAGQQGASLPIALRHGSADVNASINGSLRALQIQGQLAITNFVAKDSLFNRLSFELAASPSGVRVRNGLLLQKNLHSTFDGSLGLVEWKPMSPSPVSANINLQNTGLGDLLALGGESNVSAAGALSGEIHIDGTYGDLLGSANIQMPAGQIQGQAFSNAAARIALSHGLLSLDSFQIATAGGTLDAKGSFHHPADTMTAGRVEVHVRSSGIQLAMLQPLQQNSPGTSGALNLTADAAMDVSKRAEGTVFKIDSIETNLSATSLRVRNQAAGDLVATAHTASGTVGYNVRSGILGGSVNIQGRTSLSGGYATEARAVVQSLSLRNALEIAGRQDIPVTGSLSADATLKGNLATPDVSGSLDLTRANVYGEPINHLLANVRHNSSLTEISALNLDVPAGRVSLAARYEHPHSLNSGSIEVHVRSGDLQLARLRHVQLEGQGFAGVLHLTADAAASITENHGSSRILLSTANANVTARGIARGGRSLGGFAFTAQTSKTNLNFQFDSDLAQSKIRASGQSQLVAGYPTRATLEFNDIHYRSIAPFLNLEERVAPSFDAVVEGKASVDGPLENARLLRARLDVDRFDVQSAIRTTAAEANARSAVYLQNDGPLSISLDKAMLKVERFQIKGPKTAINVAGGVDFDAAKEPLQLRVDANADLEILHQVSDKFYSSGAVTLDAKMGGTFAQPSLNGKLALKNASVNYADIPNGLSNGNGVILLNGTTATVQSLTGESGGGKVSISGFVGLSPRALAYNLKATAAKVRTLYNNVSITSNGNFALIGNSRRSLLTGKVIIEQVGYSSSSDIGSMLYGASSPPTVSSAPSPLLSNMRLDINVITSSDVRVVTSFVEKLDLNSNLTLRGTAAEPGVLGHVTVTDGQLVFFGNTYTVNRGTVNFYDPSSIRPDLNFSLETIAQGVDVVVDVTGPVNDMKLSYRSDPPLSFEQIAALLATNTTPYDPTIAAHQPSAPQQSMSQMGESAVLSQAIASPVASRVQRVFGLTQFKIDPSIAGSNGQPTARVTLQQKIANNITFTYITDVTQSNSEIVRVQWDLSNRTSAVALRDYNGNVSVELFYKFQKR